MQRVSRRLFLGASFAALGTGRSLLGQDAEPKKEVLPESFLRKVVPELPSFQPSTLFLTWHRDPTTTMVVQWVGTRGETADTTVSFSDSPAAVNPPRREPGKPLAPSPAGTAAAVGAALAGSPAPTAAMLEWRTVKPSARPYPLSDFTAFRAELTGLKPGTEHVFKIGRSSPTYRFRTMSARATDTISFISGGDCGVNQACLDNNRVAARQDPMFAVVGGDLGYDNGRSVDISLAFLRNYSSTMVDSRGRLIPLVPCIGNHEVVGGYATRDKATFFYPLFDGLFPDTGYTALDFGDYLSLVLLDTNHTSKVAGEQTDWLDRALAARKDRPHVICVNHVPAYPSYRNPIAVNSKDGKTRLGTGEDQRQHWAPLFDKHRVPVVLEHHDHTFKRTHPLLGGLPHDNGVLYLGDGSWGRLRIPRRDDPLHVMARTSADYHISLHRLQGPERFHLALGTTGQVMDVARTGQRKAGIVSVRG